MSTPIFVQRSGITDIPNGGRPGYEFRQPTDFWTRDADASVKSGAKQLRRYEALYGPYPHEVYMYIWECEDLGEVGGSPGHRRLRLVKVHREITRADA